MTEIVMRCRYEKACLTEGDILHCSIEIIEKNTCLFYHLGISDVFSMTSEDLLVTVPANILNIVQRFIMNIFVIPRNIAMTIFST
jgi:hypothetical protein